MKTGLSLNLGNCCFGQQNMQYLYNCREKQTQPASMPRWGEDEKRRLAEYISKHDGEEVDWEKCAKAVGRRCARQCYDQHRLHVGGSCSN